MHLWTEAKALAQKAWDESDGDLDSARDYLYQSCGDHEVAIYYSKAIKFCAEQETGPGEDWLEAGGGICEPGDSFGQIACRIAFATLLCAGEEALQETADEAESEES